MLCSLEGLKIGGDLLLGFQATDIAFCLIVGKGDPFHKGKGQPPVLMGDQSV